MKKERILLVLAIITMTFMVGTCSLLNVQDTKESYVTDIDLVEFELVRDSLYECAMTICEGLAECDGSCFYTDVDEEYVKEFKECRVPSLESLLYILDQIDKHGSVWDVYDDDEGTVFEYYTYRERYENYF